mgnify:CR=1 FL=1
MAAMQPNQEVSLYSGYYKCIWQIAIQFVTNLIEIRNCVRCAPKATSNSLKFQAINWPQP